jgi:hypothetical protein
MKAHVRNGQVVLDEPLRFPDGTRLRIVAEEQDAALEASIARGIADMRAGRGTDADEFLAELEAEDRDKQAP